MELSLFIIFWYGVIHAFSPDHLSAIADFSINKKKKETLIITLLFALGHGFSLFVFAKLLSIFDISDDILAYGDIVSSCVLILMGLYLLFMVFDNRIQVDTHLHNSKEHIHIYFSKYHKHDENFSKSSSLGIGVLMGIGGVRGMLITLSAVSNEMVDLVMVGAFTIGVILVFGLFGLFMGYINSTFLGNVNNARKVFATIGFISLGVGINILI